MVDAVATPPAPVVAAPTPVASTVPPVTPPAGAAATPATPPAASPADPAAPSLLGADGKPVAPPPAAAPAKPDYSKLKLPDGTKLGQADLDAMKVWGEKHNLTPEVVQAALEERNGAVNGYHESLIKGHQQTVATNKKAIEEHPTLGGANLKATDEAVTQVLTQFAPKGLMERIQAAGYQYDPDFLQMLVNIRTATKGDTFVPSGGAPPSVQPKGLESMYETKKK